MGKLAICFSGQGSQYAGMGLDLVDQNQLTKDLTNQASTLLQIDLKEQLNNEEAMQKTSFVQPLIVFKSILGLELLDPKKYQIDGYFGFSLGEFSAYYASGVYSLENILKIVKARGEFMQQASIDNPGSMAAIIGLDYDKINHTIAPLAKNGIIKIANENGFNQYVISGETPLVTEAVELLKANGARRAVLLNVSGAFHTPMMEKASNDFINLVKDIEKQPLSNQMLMNFDASWLNSDDIDHHLKNQMTSSVKFIDMVLKLKKEGFTHVLEIGPGKVLTGLVKKIDLDMEVQNFDTFEQYEETKGWLESNGFTK